MTTSKIIARSGERSGLAALFLLSLSWGSSGLAIRELEGVLTPFQQIALTSILGCFFVTAARVSGRLPLIPRLPRQVLVRLQLRVILTSLIAVPLFYHAVSTISVAEAAWLSGLPFSAFWGWVLFRERLTPRLSAALAISAAGSAVLFVEKSGTLQLSAGLLTAPLSGAFFALAAVATRTLNEGTEPGAVEWHILLMSGFYAGSTALMLDGLPPPPRAADWGWITFASMQVALNTGLLLFGYSKVQSGVASLILALESLWATCISLFVLGEPLSSLAAFGGALLVGSTLVPCVFRLPTKNQASCDEALSIASMRSTSVGCE